jgi:putative phosphoesterase
MKCVLFSDVHGNKLAFNSFIKEVELIQPEKVFFLGDAIGYFPDGEFIINELRVRGYQCLKGNHEAMFLGEIPYKLENEAVYKLKEHNSNLAAPIVSWLSGLPHSLSIELDNLKIRILHGSLENELSGYIYEKSYMDLSSLSEDVLAIGNTHRTFIKKIGKKTIVNIGSIGLPRDGKGASFAVIDTNTCSVELKYFDSGIKDQVNYYKQSVHETVTNCLIRNINVKN